MAVGDLYRIEAREQNSTRKYYLIREICTDNRKFTASRLITSGTPPTRTEINRCASHYGFDLELKCVMKAVKFRVGHFHYDQYEDTDAFTAIEEYRLLQNRKQLLNGEDRITEYVALTIGRTVEETGRLFGTGYIPRGMDLNSINIAQNLYHVVLSRDKKPMTPQKIRRIHMELNQFINEKPLDLPREIPVLLKGFYGRIKEGFHPFEQCLLLYQDLMKVMPEEHILTSEIYANLLENYGYPFLPDEAFSWESTLSFVKENNPLLEFDIRHLNETKFKIRAGGQQKQLDFF